MTCAVEDALLVEGLRERRAGRSGPRQEDDVRLVLGTWRATGVKSVVVSGTRRLGDSVAEGREGLGRVGDVRLAEGVVLGRAPAWSCPSERLDVDFGRRARPGRSGGPSGTCSG